MLEKIALIASVVSALTAVTTSLRALGKSRENARYELQTKVKTGCRTGNYNTGQPTGKQGNLLIYLTVTFIWLALSAIFAAPLFIQRWSNGIDIRLFLWVLPFALLGIVLWIIWWKILHPPSTPQS